MIESAMTLIKKNEGTGPVRNGRFFPYKCSADKLTMGFGRNIEDIGISSDEAHIMLRNDITSCLVSLRSIFPKFDSFNKDRKLALIDMIYNLGNSRFSNFKKMINAIHKGNWREAAIQAIDSKWYTQVGIRATTIVKMLDGGR